MKTIKKNGLEQLQSSYGKLDVLNYIGGEFLSATCKRTLANIDPARNLELGTIPDSDKEDIQRAVNSAKKAFPAWQSLGPAKRSAYLHKLATAIEDHFEELCALESFDTGKPLKLVETLDIPRSSSNFRFYAEMNNSTGADCHFNHEQNALNYTMRHPLGVVGIISPWNLPLYLLTWKIAPALVTGNTVVAKPSELTPLTANFLGKLCNEVGLPAGVLNIVHGHGSKCGEALVQHPEVRAISFTGGTATGTHIYAQAAKQMKKVSLEMGGKNPGIVFADADLERSVEASVRGAFTNQGQVCLCTSRLLIHESIYDNFKELYLGNVRKLTVLPPFASGNLGGLISAQHLDKVDSFVNWVRNSDKKMGMNILCGGKRAEIKDPDYAEGAFYLPTVIEGAPADCQINQEEVFGPVVTLIPFRDEEEAIALANSTDYGLAASIYSQDIDRAHRVASQIKSGVVWINNWNQRDLRIPFGGMKGSGLGREGGAYSLQFFTEPQNITVSISK